MLLNIDWQEVISNIQKGNISPFLIKIYNKIYSLIPHSGIKVTEEDWDYLIVLDACRYDIFEEVNWIEGELQKIKSQGAQTDEWLEKNFAEKHEDMVYVSANPHLNTHGLGNIDPEETFHDYYLTYLREECNEYGATRPECVNEDAKAAAEKYPDKRIIIHYIQPHAPFIGEKRIGEGSLYELYASGKSCKEIREAYKSNLEYVLEEVEKLIPELDGEIIITADHGELLGEKLVYGHKKGLHMKELTEVPWLKAGRR